MIKRRNELRELLAQALRIGFSTYGAENMEPSTYQLENGRAANAGGCASDDDGTRRHPAALLLNRGVSRA